MEGGLSVPVSVLADGTQLHTAGSARPLCLLPMEPPASPHQQLQRTSAGCVLIPILCPLLLQLLSKYDPQKEAELRGWIEGLTGLSIGPDFQKGLKDGIILCT